MDGLSTVLPDQERMSVDRAKDKQAHDRTSADHARAATMIRHTLTLGDAAAYHDLSAIARHRLTLQERGGLAIAFLTALPEDIAMQAATTALGGAGDPLAPFLGGMEEARSWATWANPNERKAYGLACFEAMSPEDQSAFIGHIQKTRARQ